jgi:hypothetical protein
VCGSAFRYPGKLLSHQTETSKHGAKKKRQCENSWYPKMFYTNPQVTTHMKICVSDKDANDANDKYHILNDGSSEFIKIINI